MPISPLLHPYLDDIEARINPDEEERLLRNWIEFSDQGAGEPVFSPRRQPSLPPALQWPRVTVNRALEDEDQMILQQFKRVSELLESTTGLLLHVRSNYGTSILPSLFGVEMFIMEEALDTLPTSVPLNDRGAVQRLLDRGLPQPAGGWGARTLHTGERFAEIARQYPKIGKYVSIYHPDTQGPMDICEVLWGSSIFYALYDCPETVKALLELVTETYIRFMRAWEDVVPFRPGGNCHWGYFHRGNIVLRDDSAMNLSSSMFEEFVRPYDQRLLDTFGGGVVHFCGKGDHFIEPLSQMRGLYAINLTQPHLNNMEKILRNTVDRGIRLLGLERSAAEKALERGRDLKGFVHC